jgi:hypothetical protein
MRPKSSAHFREYAANISPRQIAERLNEEGIPGPHGRSWRVSTINGDRQRQNGMLQNRLYAGFVHNRTSKVTDPRTRVERIKPNPESEWVSEPVPELRIVPDDLWEAVQVRRRRIIGIPYGKQKRPRRLLSGMCQCGICGGTWTVIGLERWGCARHRNGDGCANNRTIGTEQLEGACWPDCRSGCSIRNWSRSSCANTIRNIRAAPPTAPSAAVVSPSAMTKLSPRSTVWLRQLPMAPMLSWRSRPFWPGARERDRLEAELREIDALPVMPSIPASPRIIGGRCVSLPAP